MTPKMLSQNWRLSIHHLRVVRSALFKVVYLFYFCRNADRDHLKFLRKTKMTWLENWWLKRFLHLFHLEVSLLEMKARSLTTQRSCVFTWDSIPNCLIWDVTETFLKTFSSTSLGGPARCCGWKGIVCMLLRVICSFICEKNSINIEVFFVLNFL